MVKLPVNGKFVNGIRDAEVKKGYLSLESEGGEIRFFRRSLENAEKGLAANE